jgi:hypothetical protein
VVIGLVCVNYPGRPVKIIVADYRPGHRGNAARCLRQTRLPFELIFGDSGPPAVRPQAHQRFTPRYLDALPCAVLLRPYMSFARQTEMLGSGYSVPSKARTRPKAVLQSRELSAVKSVIRLNAAVDLRSVPTA